MENEARKLVWSHLGAIAYAPAARLQVELCAAVRKGEVAEQLLTLEHAPPVFTLGRNATEADITSAEAWRTARGIEVYPSNRGGKVTYHGPGQLVAYPIINLDPDRRDVRRYVQDLEAIIIQTLAEVGVAGRVREGKELIGVWAGPEDAPAKIASIGVHLSHWVTTHGFALNVSTELDHFRGIVACGLGDVVMTSVEQESGTRQEGTYQTDPPPRIHDLATRVAHLAAARFERRLEVAGPAEIAALRARAEQTFHEREAAHR
jgi:lipoyl(octanoyl) transferase